tara:strand:- start:170 stop:403 length:234 start_codon:yes stop_codon:yes gene_type:complete
MITDQECKKALKLFNSGQWLQLEGSVGRWVDDFVQSEIIVQDKKNGTVSIIDGYGRHFNYNKGHIDWDRVSTIQMEG